MSDDKPVPKQRTAPATPAPPTQKEATHALTRLTVSETVARKLSMIAGGLAISEREAGERSLALGAMLLADGHEQGFLIVSINTMDPAEAYEFGCKYSASSLRPEEVT